MRTFLFVVLAATFSGAGSGVAQANPDSIKQRNDCRLAEQVIATGEPRPHAAWASTQILTCGAEAFTRSVTAGLQRLRHSSDTTGLSVLWDRALLSVNSQSVFDLGSEIAADASASPLAREFAFMGLLRMLKPDVLVDFATVTRTDREGHYRSSFCYGGRTAGVRPWVFGSPLNADAGQRLRAVGRTVLAEAGAPPPLRAAAYCADRL